MQLSKQAIAAITAFFVTASQAKTRCIDIRAFENQVSKASPTIEDCEDLYDWLDKGKRPQFIWTVGDMQSKLVYWHSCIIGGQRNVSGTSAVGSDDMRYIIRYSIDNFKFTFDDGITRVGTRGWMQCGDDAEHDQVEWGLY